jgi:pSer/pThr/pTyr-binding forkhead associated (FHA) protein
VITLTLLHPVQLTPVQCWTFEDDSIVRIGRSTDNQVILYSAVVSRYHVELRRTNLVWEIVNLGANGTYLEGKRITQVPVKDGIIIRLARSGPNLQIHLGLTAGAKSPDLPDKATLPQRITSDLDDDEVAKPEAATQPTATPLVPALPTPPRKLGLSEQVWEKTLLTTCTHLQATADLRFCPECGAPLHMLKSIGDYKLIQLLEQTDTTLTYLAWIRGRTVVLKTLAAEWVQQKSALDGFEQEAKLVYCLTHADIPAWLDFFVVARQPYLAIEVIHGQTLLKRVMQQGAIAPAQAITWMMQLCNILDYLHQQPIPVLNREITPETLIWRAVCNSAQQIALLDFGNLKLPSLSPRRHLAGYMAPENESGNLTPASNLFALGITLAFLISGQDPSEFYSQREQGYRFYAEYVPGMPPDLVPVIRQLTHPNPADRYQSALEVAEVLRGINQAQ